MQVLNDKLFETEKLKPLGLKKHKFVDRNQTFMRSSKDQEDYKFALTEQQNRVIMRSEERKA